MLLRSGQWDYMQPEKHSWIYDLLLIAVLALASYLRVSGVDWGEGQHQHPDELFLTGVTENLRAHVCMDEGVPIDACPSERQRWMNPLEYFNTATSTLNPNNRGAGFYVYGNLPLTLVRVTYESIPVVRNKLIGMGGWFAAQAGNFDEGPLKYFGRQFSAMADLFTILILYFIVARLYNRKTALLAAAFSALAVMQIQQSHYYTVDLFMNPFMYAALYFAVRIAYDRPVHMETGTQVDTDTNTQVVADVTPNPALSEAEGTQLLPPNSHFLRDPIFRNSLLFGLMLGMAAACKINAAVLAVMLPVALVIRFGNWGLGSGNSSSEDKDDMQRTTPNLRRSPITQYYLPITICLLVGGIATILAFRVFQPYAFNGLLPNPQWIDSMKEIRAQAYIRSPTSPSGDSACRLASSPGQVSSTWAGAFSKANIGIFCSGCGWRSTLAGSRSSSIPPCVTNCPSIRSLR
jgi:hypothetical protein